MIGNTGYARVHGDHVTRRICHARPSPLPSGIKIANPDDYMETSARVPALTLLGLTLLTGCALRPTRPAGDVASWYGSWHQGRPTATGEPYNMYAWTAAHPSLPLGTCVQVVNLTNGRHVT